MLMIMSAAAAVYEQKQSERGTAQPRPRSGQAELYAFNL
uniref:Uncharacterized protein n=1 Tax=Picea sitchensis TaxID=3332 RepID=A9NJZ0_PICSI|nr:unknown [Picea sitchensis]